MNAGEVVEVVELLEGGALNALGPLYASVREPWLVRGLLLYHARTGSERALEALARAPDLHARHLLDALRDDLAAPARRRALAALSPLLARRPPWLHLLPHHPLLRDVVRVARQDHDPAMRQLALLALAALAAHAPQAAGPLLPDLADAMLRAAPDQDPHLPLAAHALFHALYAHHPAALLDALRKAARVRDPAARSRLRVALPSLLDAARLHPQLVLPEETAGAPSPAPASPPRSPPPAPPPPSPPPPGAAGHAARAAAALRPPAEPWFPLSERCGADSAPHTPLPAEEGAAGSPPEAAVEATPENTPAKESRAQFSFPTESSAVRALGRLSQPPSPLRKEGSPAADRLARVVLDRAQVESPVPFGGAPPLAVARPEPRAPPPLEPEDREVLELTALTTRAPSSAWLEPPPALPFPPPRPARPAPPLRRGRPPRRSVSCPPRAPRRRHSAHTQTEPCWPEPYEFVAGDVFRSFASPREERGVAPSARLDAYLERVYAGGPGAAAGSELALTHAALMYERWLREAHAERCRRLLGRCRAARALELSNAALKDRVRALGRELEELRARSGRGAAAGAAGGEARLGAALAEERAARDRAEALLHESESQRAEHAAELQKLRSEKFEAERRGESLGRAVAGAGRRADLVRRLQREVLLLSERLAARQEDVGVGGAGHDEAAARRVRAEAAAARVEADAAAARADAAAARAHELEVALAARDAAALDLKRAARAAADEHSARLAALQDKYRALLHVQRRMETRALGAAPAAAPRAAAPCAAPSLEDCVRLRLLLEDEDQ